MHTKKLLIYSLIFFLSGCFDSEKEEVHTVDWFLNNLSVMDDTLKKCNNNPGELLKTENCQNAMYFRESLKRIRITESTWQNIRFPGQMNRI